MLNSRNPDQTSLDFATYIHYTYIHIQFQEKEIRYHFSWLRPHLFHKYIYIE